MADLEFDRAAVGISAKKDWHDSETLARISKFVRSIPAYGIAKTLEECDNSGTSALSTSVSKARTTLGSVIAEFSDACAVLGSGEEEAIGNMDRVETENSEAYQTLKNGMEG